MSDPSSLRVADADRERLVEELREHTVAGRLTAEEFEERLGLAYSATTRADVEAIRVDLPMTAKALERAQSQRRTQLRGRLIQEGIGSVGASAVSVAIWLASGAQGNFWPIWVILFTLLPLLRDGWRLFGPAPDLETVEARLHARREHRLDRERRRSHYRRLPR
jgi:hypothetical protein